MIDYDEMNRTLEESERELAIAEAQRKREWEFFDLEPGIPDYGRGGDGGDDGDDEGCYYEIAKAQTEMVITTLERRMEAARKDYDQLPKTEKSLRQDLLILIVRYLAHLGGFPLICGILYGRVGLMDYVGTIGGTLWLIATILFTVKFLDGIAYFAVMKTTARSVPFIEANRILTLEKMRDYASERIRCAKNRMDRVDVLDRKLERQRYLDRADLAELSMLGRPYEVTCPYRPSKVSFLWYVLFLIRGNRMD